MSLPGGDTGHPHLRGAGDIVAQATIQRIVGRPESHPVGRHDGQLRGVDRLLVSDQRPVRALRQRPRSPGEHVVEFWGRQVAIHVSDYLQCTLHALLRAAANKVKVVATASATAAAGWT